MAKKTAPQAPATIASMPAGFPDQLEAQRQVMRACLNQPMPADARPVFPQFRGVTLRGVARGYQTNRDCFFAFVSFDELARLKRLVSESKDKGKTKTHATDEALEMATYGQRALDTKRVDAIRSYIEKNPNDFVLPPVTISVDHDARFDETNGKLLIPEDSKIHVIDGQHRIAACELLADGKLGHRQIGVFIVRTYYRSEDRQFFADINSTAKVVPGAKNILFNGRDTKAVWVQNCEFDASIADYVDFKAVSPRKGKLLAAAGLYAIAKEFRDEKDFRAFLTEYLAKAAQLDKAVFSSIVFACAFARYFDYAQFPQEDAVGTSRPTWSEWMQTSVINELSYEREDWEGICVFNGALSKSAKLVNDTFHTLRGRLDDAFHAKQTA